MVHEKVAAIGFLKIWNDLLKEELVRSYKGSKLANFYSVFKKKIEDLILNPD